MEPMNSRKNKLNNKIILIFNPNPNTHLIVIVDYILNFIVWDGFRSFKLHPTIKKWSI